MADLDPQVQSEIERVIAKDPSEITKEDRVFLRARASYVGKKSRQKFPEVFSGKDEVIEKEPAPVVDQRYPGVVEAAQKDVENGAVDPEEEDIEDEDEDEEEVASQ